MLQKLFLQNFRSFQKTSFTFSSDITVLFGANTSGKTNILEAIFLLSTGKSFRADKDSEMIRYECQISNVKCQINLENDQKELEVKLTCGEINGEKTPIKRFFVNGIARRSVDFVGNLRTVLFWPEDLELITDSPSIRRRYLDFVLIQIDREYRRSLFSYEKGIRQRNKLLERIRDEGINRVQLLFWNQLLIKTGNYITDKRAEFINKINKSSKPFGKFELYYDSSSISQTRLDQYVNEEVASAITLVGPHRDDFLVMEEKRDLSKYGSRGEQRLAILWLKLAELEYVAQITEERPLLILDDIFSELDHKHREDVINIIDKQQTIVTSADNHFIPSSLSHKAQIINLK